MAYINNDTEPLNINTASIDRLCRIYLIHSLLYYEYDVSFIDDKVFDNLCKRLYTAFDSDDEGVSDYFKQYINKESLAAGSGFDINFKGLPTRVKMIALTLKGGIDIRCRKVNLGDYGL